MAPPPVPPSARRLREALGAPSVRPNPPGGRWQLQRRHAEGGDWWTVEEATVADVLWDWVAGPPERLDYGDLVRARRPGGGTVEIWVQTRSVLSKAGPPPAWLRRYGDDWEEAWEGPRAEADDLLLWSENVDRRRLVLAACDCAESSLPRVILDEEALRQGIEVARAWARGEASEEELIRASETSSALNTYANSNAQVYGAAHSLATAAAANALSCAFTGAGTARIVAAHAARASAADPSSALDRLAARRALSPLVRRWIPLPVVLLARAKEPTPLELGF